MKVSVVIPVFNAELYIEDAVISVLHCRYVGEIILIEDGSTDGSLEICKRLAIENDIVRLIQHPDGMNCGAGASRNLGIREAVYELVAFLDADDYYLDSRFDSAVQVLSDNPDVDGVYGAVGTVFDNHEQQKWWLEKKKYDAITRIQGVIAPEDLFMALFTGKRGWIHTSAITVRKSLFDKTGLFNERLKMCQDADMWFKMSIVGEMVKSTQNNDLIAMRRLHGENRIFRQQDEHVVWHRKMRESLWNWIREKDTTEPNIALVGRSVLRDRAAIINSKKRGIAWRWAILMENFLIILQWPRSILDTLFRKEILRYFKLALRPPWLWMG